MGRDNPDKSYARELLGLLREELAHLRSTPLWEGAVALPIDEKLRSELRAIERELA